MDLQREKRYFPCRNLLLTIVFESFLLPEKLDEEICKLADKEESSLSRLIATYDWEYNAKTDPTERLSKYWEVLINGWHKPWNRELESELSFQNKNVIIRN